MSAWTTVQPDNYSIAIPVFEGPLDLLLHLIEHAELDITKVALAQVTDQYLAYLHTLRERDPEGVSSFLVIAARLLQIKSEALLPRPPERMVGEEDPGDALARQLMEYKRYKQISQWLGQRDAEGYRTYLHIAPEFKVDGRVDLDGIGLADLLVAAQDVFARRKVAFSLSKVIGQPRLSIRAQIGQIIQEIRTRGRITFQSLLGKTRSRLDVVVTFLAMLELVKLDRLAASQEMLFGEIELEAIGDSELDEDFELEFGE